MQKIGPNGDGTIRCGDSWWERLKEEETESLPFAGG